MAKKQTPKAIARRSKPEKPKVKEFMEIDGSPVPGITLRQILGGHTDVINRISWSPNGIYLASPSYDGTIRIWDPEQGSHIMLKGTDSSVFSTVWSPDGLKLASGSEDGTVCLWDFQTKKPTKLYRTIRDRQLHLNLPDNENPKGDASVSSIVWLPSGKQIIVALPNHPQLLTYKVGTDNLPKITDIKSPCGCLALSKDGKMTAAGCLEGVISIIDNNTLEELYTLKAGDEPLPSIAWSPSNQTLAAASYDKRIYLWDMSRNRLTHVLEGHNDQVMSVAFSFDGKLLASRSNDGIVLLWRTDNWTKIALIEDAFEDPVRGPTWNTNLAFHPNSPILATFGYQNTFIRIWNIDYQVLLGIKLPDQSVRYTTAKLVLVGDSGVGKTGLGWRLAHNEFKEHSSTHGQQFWVLPELGRIRRDGTECEAVLWDLAGQPDYRLVHSLYLDDVDTALILFDPTNRQEPLAGVDFWLNQLINKDKKLRNSILVGARTDRGISTLTDAELKAYCKRNGILGGFIPTSAKEGIGLSQLLATLKNQIPWDALPATVTTVTFKRIKEFVLSLKENSKRRRVLLQPLELRKQLEKTDRTWKFTNAEMMTAVGHLEKHGYVRVLHSSNGEEIILLSPDILANLASSIVLEARRNPRGLGVLEEARLLTGEYQFPELNKINTAERKILLDAAAVIFIEHNLCFREIFNQQVFLVFPSLINEKRPIDEGATIVEGETYQVKGTAENLYASLVVLLGYTNTFVRTHQWQNQAQYEMGAGEVCGFQQVSYPDGSIELVLNYGEKTPDPVRLMFRGLFERFLSRRDLEIARYQTVVCQKCGTLLARNVVKAQMSKGKNFSFCHECGEKVSLPNPEPLTRLSPKQEVEINEQQAIAQYRTAFEAALVRVKGLLRDQGKEKKPTCFISYAWGVSENERWVLQLSKDLRNADIDILLDRWHSPPGSNLDLYIERVLSSDFVIAVGTPELCQKYETRKADPVVAAELKLINLRVRQTKEYGETVLPVLLTGDAKKSLPPQLQPLVSVDFRETDFYFRRLFDMIWRLYDLPFDNPILEELRDSMTPQGVLEVSK
jgi:small GTP-binding protein